MRASWFALHASLRRVLNRDDSETDFQKMAKAYSDLALHASIAALMEHLHLRNGDPLDRFRIIRVLVIAAQSEQPFRRTAQIMVIVALWPGLDAVFWRLARGFPNDRECLSSEIVARISEALLILDLAKVTAVTATLLRNVERDIRRDLIDARILGQATMPIDDKMVEAEATVAAASVCADDRNLDDWLGGISADETNLLRRVFVLGETQEEAGRALGLSAAAARKRVRRTLQKLRLRQKNNPFVSHSSSPNGL